MRRALQRAMDEYAQRENDDEGRARLLAPPSPGRVAAKRQRRRELERERLTRWEPPPELRIDNFEFDGVKLDSCSQFNNLSLWSALINASGRATLIENCHQGAYTPGMRQWQGYLKSSSGSGSGYTHFLGMFFGMAAATPLLTEHG